MRTIKFRGKDKKGNWVYGYLSYSYNEEIHYIGVQEIMTPVITETVGQFTGLLDKNGNEIYEGDVVKSGSTILKIEWNGGNFSANPHKGSIQYPYFSQSNMNRFEITGNIHDQ